MFIVGTETQKRMVSDIFYLFIIFVSYFLFQSFVIDESFDNVASVSLLEQNTSNDTDANGMKPNFIP